eukprot:06849.XXX_321748_327244_1 [CDS] Oithona nana genome sequencing.
MSQDANLGDTPSSSSGNSIEANASAEAEYFLNFGVNSSSSTETAPRQRFNPSTASRVDTTSRQLLGSPNTTTVLEMPNTGSNTTPLRPYVSQQANDLFRQLSQGNEEMLNRVTAQLHAAHQDQVRPDPAQPTRQPQDDQGRENETNSESFSFSGYFSRLMRSNPEMVGVFSTFEKYIPFVLILVTKQLFDHSTGIFVFVALVCTFYHANSVVTREVSRNGRRASWPLLIVMINLTACIGLIYFVFEDQKLYECAVFMRVCSVTSLSELLWTAGVNDFVLKFISVIIKIGIILVPSHVLQHRKRGNYFLFIELASQLHRTLLPIPVWIYYLMDNTEKIPSKILGVILIAAYMVFKGKSIMTQFVACKSAAAKLLQSTRYGNIPSSDELKATGGTCPICHDNLREPTKLHCKHIFCEECVATWFDREKTCPMCRAQVTEDPAWRDGSTQQFIQFF